MTGGLSPREVLLLAPTLDHNRKIEPLGIAQAIASTEAIAGATDRIVTARVLSNIASRVREGRMPPPIEIKGLGAIVADARKAIAGVRSETAGLNTDAGNLVLAVKDVRAQIQQAHADLKFEAETLGNGGESKSETESGKSEG